MKRSIHISGKRKSARARATLCQGSGKIRINSVPLDKLQPKIARMKLMEPLLLAGDIVKSVDIDVNIYGGGSMSQAMAGRLAIGRALSQYNTSLKSVFLEYDRQLLIADVRRKEPRKPNTHGKARSKVQKSYR